jgi:cytochrome c biogenesis protein CcdA
VIWPTFAEGVEAIVLPCSWTLLVPAVVAVGVALGRRMVVVGTIGGLVLGLMTRAAGIGLPVPLEGPVAGVLLGAGLLLICRSQRWAGAGGSITGVAAASMWQPCVGARLGSILSLASPLEAASQMIPYALGVTIPVVAVGLMAEFVPRTSTGWVSRIAAILGVVLVLVVVTGWHHPVVGILARWSVGLAS